MRTKKSKRRTGHGALQTTAHLPNARNPWIIIYTTDKQVVEMQCGEVSDAYGIEANGRDARESLQKRVMVQQKRQNSK